ncbi:MAG: multicopper oxidase family protein [Thiolinea sp.]
MVSRRKFLSFPCAAALTPTALLAETSSKNISEAQSGFTVLQATTGTVQLAPKEYPATNVWAFDGTVPGTPIRLKQGERVQRVFENKLKQPSAVHWHGIRIDNKMDGVPGLTQKVVPTGGRFVYDFVVPDAGTYWYHTHHRSWEQLARGMYGPLIVEEENPPQVDRDELLIIDDWRLDNKAQVVENFGMMHDKSHAGRTGSWATVNSMGMDRAALSVQQNERLRLRLINVANATVFNLVLEGMQGKVVALDGQPLAVPEALGMLTMAPAQRIDLIVDVVTEQGKTAMLNIMSRGQKIPLMRFAVEKQRRDKPLETSEALPANPLPVLNSTSLATAPVTELRLEGGAMGRMRSATYKGREMGIRELVDEGMVWAMNGVAGMTEQPLFTAKREQTQRLKMINETGWPHGMHLHGHHFREVLADGKLGPWRDTLLLQPRETREVALVADNPGDWLLHCHMMEHQMAGMKTWYRVLG